MKSTLWCICALMCVHMSRSLENGLARTPPMGWMSWERFRCITDCRNYPNECISEQLFRAMADRMASDGYLDAGYEYVIIDDCWSSHERDENGRLQPDPERFPRGIKSLSDYVHEKGLKLGIYGDYGTKTCGGYPGSLDYLELDANTFADWGVDYLKLDGCYVATDKMEKGYAEMGKYLNATDRPIVYSCSWPAYMEPVRILPNYDALVETCNLWRNWDDIEDSWSMVEKIMGWFSSNQGRLANYSGPGHWNDPDMLIIGNYGLSYEQSKSQMAIWAILAAPLLMSVDLRTIEPSYRNILLNEDVIAINQDALGIQGLLIDTKDKIQIWQKPILPIVNDCKSYAIAFLSKRVDGYPYRLEVTLQDFNLTCSTSYSVTNIYEPAGNVTYLSKEKFEIRVAPSGVVLLKAVPEHEIEINKIRSSEIL